LKNLLMTGIPKPPKVELIPIMAIFDDVEEQFERQAYAQQMIFELTRPQTDAQLLVDFDQMQVVFTNFYNNSAYAIASRKNNDASFKDGRLEVLWRDNGCGISERVLPTIFEPFVTDKELGTGLGLFSVKSIIENHGGNVSVNQQPGSGARFDIRLPIFEESPD